MRSWLLMFLLLLSILIHDVQGIRLIRNDAVPADRQHSIHEQLPGKEVMELKRVFCAKASSVQNDKNEEIKADPKWEAPSSTNRKIGSKEENLSVNSSSKTQQRRPAPSPIRAF